MTIGNDGVTHHVPVSPDHVTRTSNNHSRCHLSLGSMCLAVCQDSAGASEKPQLDSWLHTLHHVTNTGDPVSVSPRDNIRDYLSIVPISISHITVWSVNNQYTSLRPCRCHNNQLIPSTLVPCHHVPGSCHHHLHSAPAIVVLPAVAFRRFLYED